LDGALFCVFIIQEIESKQFFCLIDDFQYHQESVKSFQEPFFLKVLIH